MDVRSLSTDFVLDPHESDFFGHENQKVIVCSEGLGECKYQFFLHSCERVWDIVLRTSFNLLRSVGQHVLSCLTLLNIKACAMEVVVNRSDLFRVYPSCKGQVRTDK